MQGANFPAYCTSVYQAYCICSFWTEWDSANSEHSSSEKLWSLVMLFSHNAKGSGVCVVESEGQCPSHLVVMCRGRIFTFDALCNGRILTPPELLRCVFLFVMTSFFFFRTGLQNARLPLCKRVAHIFWIACINSWPGWHSHMKHGVC